MASRRPSRALLPRAFAELDLQRQQRLGAPEIVYGAGKTVSQIAAITR
ncbi:MAG: 1-(5-phosphoribosyl)-5-amino-4-imidazole-carboxylate carboxylase, partial [Verrucomicrobia bacterium]|nr:1-(5-phosphoribosyl)-5-amino-4-imidazole-carboxylate carboxylase [Verrucomicrobiota bacterium]